MKKHYVSSDAVFKWLVVFFIALNIIVFLIHSNMKTKWVGTIESPKFSWTTYATQRGDMVLSEAVYSIFLHNHVDENNMTIKYRFKRENSNTNYIRAKEASEKFARRRMQYYFIDDICALGFRGSEKMTMSNVNLLCRFS